MKKVNCFLRVMAFGIVLFTSCSSEGDPIESSEGAAQELLLQVTSTGDGLTTRAGRSLYSSEAAQDISNVKVIIYDDQNTIQYVTDIDWAQSKVYTTNGHGKQYTLSLKGTDKLSAGNYKVVAVGYTNLNTLYTYSPTFASLVKGSTYTAPISATTSNEAEEVFAGEITDLIVNADKSFVLTTGEAGKIVTLHRQVAGGFGYFKNIPASVDGKDAAVLRLITRRKNLKVEFKDFNSSFINTNNNVKYVVNGTTPAILNAKFNGSTTNDGNVLYAIQLSDWFTGGDTNGDGLLNKDDSWQHKDDVLTTVVKGSVFAGRFMIPFDKMANSSSFELQLLDADGVILKTWGVNIPSTDMNIDSTNGVIDDSQSVFNVVRNHMYNLGVKIAHTPYDPSNPDPTKPDPTDPTPDVDDPTDLSKAQDLILKVNDNWEIIHNLELD